MLAIFISCIDYPGLRHSPAVKLAVVVDQSHDKETNAEKEEVELVLSRALEYKTSLLAQLVYFSIKIETEYEINDSIE